MGKLALGMTLVGLFYIALFLIIHFWPVIVNYCSNWRPRLVRVSVKVAKGRWLRSRGESDTELREAA